MQYLSTRLHRAPLRALILLMSLLFAPALSAAVVKHMSLDDLAREATVIIKAKVGGESAAWGKDRKGIWTRYFLVDREILKGEFEGKWKDSPAAHRRGGVVGDKAQEVAGEPTLEMNKEYLLFLWKNKEGYYRFLGKSQAVFALSKDKDGTIRAANSFSGIRVVNKDGEAVAEKVGPIKDTLENLKKRIAAIVDPPKDPEPQEPPAESQVEKGKAISKPEEGKGGEE